MHQKTREWLNEVLSKRPEPKGEPETEQILEWLNSVLPTQFKQAKIADRAGLKPKDYEDDLSEPEWLIYQELEKLYPEQGITWKLRYIWALSRRYKYGLRYRVRVENGKIRYDLQQ